MDMGGCRVGKVGVVVEVCRLMLIWFWLGEFGLLFDRGVEVVIVICFFKDLFFMSFFFIFFFLNVWIFFNLKNFFFFNLLSFVLIYMIVFFSFGFIMFFSVLILWFVVLIILFNVRKDDCNDVSFIRILSSFRNIVL